MPIISTEHPVRVTLGSGSVIVLKNARLVGDSLIGDVGTSPSRMAVALSEVKHLEEKKTSAAKTGGAIGCGAVGIVAVVAVLGVMVAALSDWQ